MVHMTMHWPHWARWPYWAEQTFIEAEHEGPIQILGFVFAVTVMLAAILLALSTLILGVA